MNTHYSNQSLEALKKIVRAKKQWIAQAASTCRISDSEKLAIEARLPKLTNKVLDLTGVHMSIEIYDNALQDIIFDLCHKFRLPPPPLN